MKTLTISSRVCVLSKVYLGFFISIIGIAVLVSYQAIGINYSLLRNSNFQAPQLAHETQKEQVSSDASRLLGKLPIYFEKNAGQFDPSIKFISKMTDYELFLTSQEAILSSKNNRVLKMQFASSNSNPKLSVHEELTGKTNYFLSQDSKQWKTNVSHYGKVVYESVYPGIDLVFYGNQSQLEYDFIVSPGADPKMIRLKFEGVKSLQIDSEGNLMIETDFGKIQQHRPVIYQEVKGLKIPIQGGYVIQEQDYITFNVAQYDNTLPLIIDPVLVFSTYLGGKEDDWANDIAVDKAGNIYIVGGTSSSDFPGSNDNVVQPNKVESTCIPWSEKVVPCSDAFITKIDPTGKKILFTTFLGGTGTDSAQSLVLDKVGNILICGETSSLDFPVMNAVQSFYGGGDLDAFVAKLSPDGTQLLYSTYLGGSGDDEVLGGEGDYHETGFLLNAQEEVIIVGSTDSMDFPVVDAVQSFYGGGDWDAFVAKLSPDGTQLLYSTYLGGSGVDLVNDFALNTLGEALIVGETSSPDLDTTENVIQPELKANLCDNYDDMTCRDGFLVKLSKSGEIQNSSYLGGDGNDSAKGVALDSEGNIYITGTTRALNGEWLKEGFCDEGNEDCPGLYIADPNSVNFPGVNSSSLQPIYGGGDSDPFIIKINPTGEKIIWSTYLGGFGDDGGYDIAVDKSNVYITGGPGDCIDPPGGFQNLSVKEISEMVADICYDKGQNGFVAGLKSDGAKLIYSIAFAMWESNPHKIIADKLGAVYVSGNTGTVYSKNPEQIQEKIFDFDNVKSGYGAFIMKISSNEDSINIENFQFEGDQYQQVPLFTLDEKENLFVAGWKNPGDEKEGILPDDIFLAKINTHSASFCSDFQLQKQHLPIAKLNKPYLSPSTGKSVKLKVKRKKGRVSFFLFEPASLGKLPPGLKLSKNGFITGTPTRTGSYYLTVFAKDAYGCSDSHEYMIKVK